METSEAWRDLIQKIVEDHAKIPYAFEKIDRIAVIDRTNDHYLLMIAGRDRNDRRDHGCIIHVDIIDGKFWIQRDGTEYGVAQELMDAGITKAQIVLAFQPKWKREDGEFAAA